MAEESLNFKEISTIFVTAMIDFIEFGIIIPIGSYYIETFGGNAIDLSILLVSYSLAQFITSPILEGFQTDLAGRGFYMGQSWVYPVCLNHGQYYLDP